MSHAEQERSEKIKFFMDLKISIEAEEILKYALRVFGASMIVFFILGDYALTFTLRRFILICIIILKFRILYDLVGKKNQTFAVFFTVALKILYIYNEWGPEKFWYVMRMFLAIYITIYAYGIASLIVYKQENKRPSVTY